MKFIEININYQVILDQLTGFVDKVITILKLIRIVKIVFLVCRSVDIEAIMIQPSMIDHKLNFDTSIHFYSYFLFNPDYRDCD